MTNTSLTPEHAQTLRTQIIDDTQPGTALRDFAALLDFIASREVKVTGTHQLLPMNLLAELNARMSHPLTLNLKRPQQKSYPHINGLYLVLRVTGLTRTERAKAKQLLVIDADALASWQKLNDTEKYCTLLEAWLLRGRGEMIGNDRDPFSPLDKTSHFFTRIPDKGLTVAGNRQEESMLPFYPGLYNIALLELFGLAHITQATSPTGVGWQIERIKRTAFGTALFALLSGFTANEFPFFDEDEEIADKPFGEWQPVLQPYFPLWQNNLTLPPNEATEGTLIFKVSLGKVWRRIAIDSRLTLNHLSNTLLYAFDFDDDHLHRFTYRNRFGVAAHVNHPFTEDAPLTSEVRVGELPIRPRDVIEYLFDFGDQWRFDIELESITPLTKAKVAKPEVLEEHGRAPQQYPDVEDEDEDEW